MSNDDSGERLTFYMFVAMKLFAALFLFKVLCEAVGFTGYIPIADEVYHFIVRSIMLLGTGRSIVPTQF